MYIPQLGYTLCQRVGGRFDRYVGEVLQSTSQVLRETR